MAALSGVPGLGKSMVNGIDNNWVPMTLPPSRTIEVRKEMATEGSVDREKDFVVLENRKEIRPRTHFEKGMFIDFYI